MKMSVNLAACLGPGTVIDTIAPRTTTGLRERSFAAGARRHVDVVADGGVGVDGGRRRSARHVRRRAHLDPVVACSRAGGSPGLRLGNRRVRGRVAGRSGFGSRHGQRRYQLAQRRRASRGHRRPRLREQPCGLGDHRELRSPSIEGPLVVYRTSDGGARWVAVSRLSLAFIGTGWGVAAPLLDATSAEHATVLVGAASVETRVREYHARRVSSRPPTVAGAGGKSAACRSPTATTEARSSPGRSAGCWRRATRCRASTAPGESRRRGAVGLGRRRPQFAPTTCSSRRRAVRPRAASSAPTSSQQSKAFSGTPRARKPTTPRPDGSSPPPACSHTGDAGKTWTRLLLPAAIMAMSPRVTGDRHGADAVTLVQVDFVDSTTGWVLTPGLRRRGDLRHPDAVADDGRRQVVAGRLTPS